MQKYFGIEKLIQKGSDPLGALVSRTALSNQDLESETETLETPTSLTGKQLAEANKTDMEITSLIKKDIQRTLPEVPAFQNIGVSQSLQQILYIWAKENPEYKYQQGLNDILAIIVVCILSDTLVKELPTHYDEDTDYEGFVNACCTNKPDAHAMNKSIATDWNHQRNQSFATER